MLKLSFMEIAWLKTIGSVTGILGFVISLVNLLYFFLIRRKRLCVQFGDTAISDFHSQKKVLKVQYTLENRSQLSVSVTRIQLICNGNAIDCVRLPVIIEEVIRKQNGSMISRDEIKSTSPPFNLPPLAAESGFLAFAIPQDTQLDFDKGLTFRICTNRGGAVQKTFALHEDMIIR